MTNENFNLAKKILQGPLSENRIAIENAMLDRAKREWNRLEDIQKDQVRRLARKHNRQDEF